MNLVHMQENYMPKLIEDPEKKILECAKKIVQIEGYDALNIRKLAGISDISIGTIYNYFSSKDSIIDRIMIGYWYEFYATIKQINIQDVDLYHKLRLIQEELMGFCNTFHLEVFKAKKITKPCPENLKHKADW